MNLIDSGTPESNNAKILAIVAKLEGGRYNFYFKIDPSDINNKNIINTIMLAYILENGVKLYKTGKILVNPDTSEKYPNWHEIKELQIKNY